MPFFEIWYGYILEKKMTYLSKQEVDSLLIKEDLSENPHHCISIAVNLIKNKLENYYNLSANIEKGSKIVSLEDNYYTLGYDRNEITLGSRYTKYISENTILRTQMSSVIPSLLRNYQKDGDKLYLCPGLVYRRDVKDKTHVGEPHQMDIWCLTKQKKNRQDLLHLVGLIIKVIEDTTDKKVEWRYNETNHNYTDNGIEVEIKHKGNWLEILECGLISQKLLDTHNLSEYSGLALGLGLERLVMIIKDIDDIRVLLDKRESIQKQLSNLKKYKQVSNQPSTKRDLSIAIEDKINEEELTEIILSIVDSETQQMIETIKIISETSYEELPKVAIERLGMIKGQKNVLLRIVLRDLVKTLESSEANNIYTTIYKNIHQGSKGYYI